MNLQELLKKHKERGSPETSGVSIPPASTMSKLELLKLKLAGTKDTGIITDTGVNVASLADRVISIEVPKDDPNITTDKYGNIIEYNDKQSSFIKIA